VPVQTIPSMKKRSSSHQPVKRVPQRTCVACRQVDDKRGLVRLVRTAAGAVEVDPTGKKAGRGAYLCPLAECWETGITGGKLEHALKVTLTRERKEELMRLGRDLIKENVGG